LPSSPLLIEQAEGRDEKGVVAIAPWETSGLVLTAEQAVEILTAAANEYRGTLLVVSHDAYFLDQIGIEISISL
jgi:hypothetical protein